MEKSKGEELEKYRIKALKYKKKKGIINFFLFNFYKKKYKEIAYSVLDEAERKFYDNIIL